VTGIALVGAVGLAWLAFGYFGVQFLFIDDKVDEAAPVFASGVVVNSAATGTGTGTASEPVAATTTTAPAPEQASTTESTVPPTTTGQPSTIQPEIVTVATGSFISKAHGTSGEVSVLTDGSEQRFLRFDNLATDNGPDLNVYLTTSDAAAGDGSIADEYVDLGNLKGNIGNQNYEIPSDVDLTEYDTVVIWCVRFGVAFGAADLIQM
jgi:hypothetical protein